MINLLTNIIIFVLRIANAITFGVLDSMVVVYSILVVTSFIVFIKLDATIGVCNVWKKAGIIPKGLILTGLVLNALPQWYLWLIGLGFIALAYFLTPLKTNKSEKPSLFSKLKAVVVEEYQGSNISSTIQKTKNTVQKSSKNRTDTKPAKDLPPI